MDRFQILRRSFLAAAGLAAVGAFPYGQDGLAVETDAAAAGATMASLGPVDDMIGRNFALCALVKDECIEGTEVAASVRRQADGLIILGFSSAYDNIYFKVADGVAMGGHTRGTIKPFIRTPDGIRVNGIMGAGMEFLRDGDNFVMIHHYLTGKARYRLFEPNAADPKVAKRLAKLDAKLGPLGGAAATSQLAAANAVPATAQAAGALPPLPATTRFGVFERMSGDMWEYSYVDNDVAVRCFAAFLFEPAASVQEVPWACETGKSGRYKFAATSPGQFMIDGKAYSLMPNGSVAMPMGVSGKLQARHVLHMISPDAIEIYREEGKAGARNPKWKRISGKINYQKVTPEIARAALAAGPKRVAAAREALIPQQWGFLADLPGKVEIGLTSNAAQRATLALNVRREPTTLLLRSAQWVERGKVMRITYTAGTGRKWSEELTRTGKGTFDIVHKGPNGDRTVKARFEKDAYIPIPQLKIQLGAMPCGPASRTLGRHDFGGKASYSDNFTAICRGGEYGGFSTPTPTSDHGSGTIFHAYTPADRKSLEGQLASMDKMHAQSDRDYVAGEKRDAVEKRRQERIEAANKARMNAVILNGIAGIANAAVQGYQQGQQRQYETERNIAAYTALGIAKRAEATGQPLDARAFNAALESALAGTGIRQSVINEMRVGTISSSDSDYGSTSSAGREGGSRSENRGSGRTGSATAPRRSAASDGSERAERDTSGFDDALARIADNRSSSNDGAASGAHAASAARAPAAADNGQSSASTSLVVKDDSAEWRKEMEAIRASREAQEARDAQRRANALADKKRREAEAEAAAAKAKSDYNASRCADPDVICVRPM